MRTSSLKLRSITAAAAITIAIALFTYYVLRGNESTAALLLTLSSMMIAARSGNTEAIVASFTAALALDYWFIPPIFKITVGEPSGWISLSVFLAASLFASSLSSKLRRQRDELAMRQSEGERLHTLGRALLLSDRSGDTRRLVVNKCIELFGFEEVSLFESASGEVWRSSSNSSIETEDLRRCAIYGSPQAGARETQFVPVMLGNKIFGSIGYRGKALPAPSAQALANTLATGLAQAQALEAGSKAEAIRRSEELKSVMLDALAHDLKTPLTTIELAAETLWQTETLAAEERTTLLKEILQAASGLRSLIHGAIHLARIDAKRLRLNVNPEPVSEIVDSALLLLSERSASHLLAVDVTDGLPAISVDRELMIQALKQLIDNALKYSPAASKIVVAATQAEQWVYISVRDQGPGLTEREQGRIFEKFYRGRHEGSAIQGTGMGLAIAKEITEAHGGILQVESKVGEGSRFTIALRAVSMERSS